MRFEVPNCPQCREPVNGTIDIIYGKARLSETAIAGNFDWDGGTDVDWNSQATIGKGDRILVGCRSGHEWLTRAFDDDGSPIKPANGDFCAQLKE